MPTGFIRRSFLAFALMLLAFVAAATEINQANEAELDSVKGLGPSTTERILQARAQAPFSDWADLMRRVKGIKPKLAAKLSEAGLRVNGQTFEATP